VGLDHDLVEDSDDEEQQLFNQCSQSMLTTNTQSAESPLQREINQYCVMPMLTKNADVLNF
jgi:hypothetical protein